MKSKLVRVAITFERLIEVREDYDEAMVLFWLNDSTHCIVNELRAEVEEQDSLVGECSLCGRASARVVDMNPPPPEPEEQ